MNPLPSPRSRPGKHVLVERPLALTPEGVGRVLDAADSAGRCLAVAINHRFRPDAGALASFVAAGELGDVCTVRGSSLTRMTPSLRSTWRQSLEQGGGVLMDLGVPMLDLAFWGGRVIRPSRESRPSSIGATTRSRTSLACSRWLTPARPSAST